MARTYLQARTAKDPDEYVRRFNASYAKAGLPITARVASIESTVTPSGQKRYTIEITDGTR